MKNTLSDILAKRDASNADLQTEFDAVFDQDKALQKSIQNAENFESGHYVLDDMLYYVVDLDTDNDYSECDEALETYLLDYGVSLANMLIGYPSLASCCGDEFYSIQNEGHLGSDLVVYQNMKEVARLSEIDPNGDADEGALYQAINDHMEKAGCFPEVIQIDDHGGVELCSGYYEWLKKQNEGSN